MKNILSITLTILLTFSFAIAQDGINYQGAATNANGDELTNQNITLRASILSTSASGNLEWEETHSATTDQFGLFNVVIGQGSSTTNGSTINFDDMDWGSGNHYLKIEMDASGGTNYAMIGTTQMMSVPYALYAKSAGIDSAAIAAMIGSSGGGMGGGCDYKFPEGLDGDAITHDLNNFNDYIVPSGKKLYILQHYGNSNTARIRIDGVPIKTAGNTNDYQYTLANPIIASSGQTISCPSNTQSVFNGIIVEENTDIQSVTHDLNNFNDYIVPSGKKLYILQHYGNSNTARIRIDGVPIKTAGNTNDYQYTLANPIIASSGQTISCPSNTQSVFNGYLADENYFAGGGGGSSSGTSNATIDSLSQVVSNLDSSLTALTSQINFGCTDPSSCNYDPTANLNDGSCTGILGCTDSTATNYNSSATCDDGSCTALAIGDTYHGGIVFYLDGIGGGLTAAIGDQSTVAVWGCYGVIITGADGTAIGTGNQNTIDIEAECTTSGIAADLCANLILSGYSDWFLPSRDELELMYINLHSQGLGSFSNDYYWSSSEWGGNDSWYVYFADGTVSYLHPPIYKASAISVRAIRAF